MNKSFKNLSKLALGVALVSSSLIGSTDSANASQITASEKENSYINAPSFLNSNTIITQFEVEDDTLFDNPMQRVDHLALNAAISHNGNTWLQPGGYQYFRLNITNTSTEDLKVYLEDNGINGYVGIVPTNTSKTFVSNRLVSLPANGKRFNLGYSSPTGKISGIARVRVSTVPL